MINFRRYFLSGLAVMLPVTLTIYIFIVLFKICDGFLNPIFKKALGIYIPGLGIIAAVIIVFIAGFLTTHFFSKRISRFLESLFINMPFIKRVYPAVKQLTQIIFSRDNKVAFNRVVLVEYPRQGIWSLGFVTNDSAKEVKQKINKDAVNILIPTTPTPLSGFMIIVPKSDVIFLDMSIEDALKVVISGGVLLPIQEKNS